jgi:hypothetical protein
VRVCALLLALFLGAMCMYQLAHQAGSVVSAPNNGVGVFRVGDVPASGVSTGPIATVVEPVRVQTPKFTAANTISATPDWPTGTWLISAQSEFDTSLYVKLKAFDKIRANNWYCAQNRFTAAGVVISPAPWIQLQFPYACKLVSYLITSPQGPHYPKTWDLEGSLDNSFFTKVQQYSQTTWAITTDYTFAVTAPHEPYLYWRLLITSKTTHSTTSLVGLGELTFTVIR